MNKVKAKKKKTHLDFGLLGVGTKNRFKREEFGGRTFATIKKRYLCVNENYQRPICPNRVKNISANFNHELAMVRAVELRRNNRYFYEVVDGQNTAAAYPSEEVLVQIVNHYTPSQLFLLANDPKTHKAASIDDIYWAKYFDITSSQQEDKNHIVFIHDVMKQMGFNPARLKTKDSDYGRFTSKIWTQFINVLSTKYDLDDRLQSQTAKEIFKDSAKIMMSMWGAEAFNQQIRRKEKMVNAWAGMLHFLVDSSHYGCMESSYDADNVAEHLSKGIWSKNAKGSAREKLVFMKDWIQAQKCYYAINNEKFQWRQLFKDAYRKSSLM